MGMRKTAVNKRGTEFGIAPRPRDAILVTGDVTSNTILSYTYTACSKYENPKLVNQLVAILGLPTSSTRAAAERKAKDQAEKRQQRGY